MGKYIAIILVLLTLVLFSLVRMLWDYPFTPLSNDQKTKIIDIPKGTSVKKVAYILAEERIISHPILFTLMCRINSKFPLIKAGEYEFRASMTPLEIYQFLEKGAYKKHYVTIPEGFTLNQISKLLVKEQLIDKNIFYKLSHDRKFIKSLGVGASSLEGYLFPDTYEFTKGSGERFILTKMVSRFHEVFTDAFKRRANELKLNVHKVVILASIIEKETMSAEEKGFISAVLRNRLRKNMPLQCDPTIIYVIEDRFDGVLRNSSLNIDSPYNTYKYSGLPPGPISNPGKESILATLYPSKENYLYFVSTNDGSHKFSKSYPEHLMAVKKFKEKRELMKKMDQEVNSLDSK